MKRFHADQTGGLKSIQTQQSRSSSLVLLGIEGRMHQRKWREPHTIEEEGRFMPPLRLPLPGLTGGGSTHQPFPNPHLPSRWTFPIPRRPAARAIMPPPCVIQGCSQNKNKVSRNGWCKWHDKRHRCKHTVNPQGREWWDQWCRRFAQSGKAGYCKRHYTGLFGSAGYGRAGR